MVKFIEGGVVDAYLRVVLGAGSGPTPPPGDYILTNDAGTEILTNDDGTEELTSG